MHEQHEIIEQKRHLNESVAKELKQIDKKKLEKINKMMKTGIASDPCIRFILNSLAKLLCEKETATQADATEYYKTVEGFHEQVRKVDCAANSKEWLVSIMKEITGESEDGG